MKKNDISEVALVLRRHVAAGQLNDQAVRQATERLATLGYEFDLTLYPPLASSHNWSAVTQESPESLAEALLWKMGKWKIYKSFVAHFSDADSKPKTTDVVFYAFAKHLRDRSKPIYDQHCLRALWAIDSKMTLEQVEICRHLLATKKGKWKQIASGAKAPDGCRLYIDRVAQICDATVSFEKLDKLLMPLGQALKTHTDGVTEFTQLTDRQR